MEAPVITRDQYKALRGHDYAGTVTKLEAETVAVWNSTYPDWLGKHWQMTHGPRLGPVNVIG
ncbi:hypothetical protein AB0C65_36070 [Nocardia sp. NPDC048505]|uniref:hypothetical protein n=1 Tax=Nocardia sp. NPDC048505 TaxID=3155756 RepID=UPI0033D17CE1